MPCHPVSACPNWVSSPHTLLCHVPIGIGCPLSCHVPIVFPLACPYCAPALSGNARPRLNALNAFQHPIWACSMLHDDAQRCAAVACNGRHWQCNGTRYRQMALEVWVPKMPPLVPNDIQQHSSPNNSIPIVGTAEQQRRVYWPITVPVAGTRDAIVVNGDKACARGTPSSWSNNIRRLSASSNSIPELGPPPRVDSVVS